MAWVWNEEEFCIDDPLDETVGAPDNRDIGRLIAIVSGEHAEEHALGPVDAQSLTRRALGRKQRVLGRQLADNRPT